MIKTLLLTVVFAVCLKWNLREMALHSLNEVSWNLRDNYVQDFHLFDPNE